MADFSPARMLKLPSPHRFRVPQIEISNTSLHFRGFGFKVPGFRFSEIDQAAKIAAANLKPKTLNPKPLAWA